MKQLAFSLAGRLPVGFWTRLEGAAPVLPYYHLVSDQPVAHVSSLYSFPTVAKFRADLDFFLSIGRPISMVELAAALARDGRAPERTFLLSFDDGFREMHDVVLPILLEKGVPAAFFVNSASVDNRRLIHHQKIAVLVQHSRDGANFPRQAVVERLAGPAGRAAELELLLRRIPWRDSALVDEVAELAGVDFAVYLRRHQPYLTSDQLRAMQAKGMHIGAHSIDHPRYSDLTLAEQLRQTRESAEFVAAVCGPGLRTFAFPHTDEGVNDDFFREMERLNLAQLTFGTAAPMRDETRGHFQRFSMEKTTLSANAVAARNFFRGARLRLAHRDVVKRG